MSEGCGLFGRIMNGSFRIGEVQPAQALVIFQLFFGLEAAGSANGISGREGDMDVEIAELAVKFTLVQVGHFMPSFAVIDGGFRIPLGDHIAFAFVSETGKIRGYLNEKGSGDGDCSSGR